MDLVDLMLAYLQWHFNDYDGEFHLGDDVLVQNAEARDDGLAVALLLANGDTREVILSARLGDGPA